MAAIWDTRMLTYKYSYQLDDVRKFAEEDRIIEPMIVHHSRGYTFYFTLKDENETRKNCVLITVKGARPREFKKARTYTRTLKANGIPRWRVKRTEDLENE